MTARRAGWQVRTAHAASSVALPKGASAKLQCSGCGAGLQSHSASGAGFLPRKAVERVLDEQAKAKSQAVSASIARSDMEGAAAAAQAGNHLICQRCYHAKHYGRLVPVEADEETFREYVRAIRRRRALVVHVVDLFDWPGSLLPDLPGLLRLDRADVDLVVAINKCDLLPKRAPRERIEAWARAGLRAAGLSSDRIAGLALVSARTGEGVESLLSAVKQNRKGRDVYVVGSVNAGKSSLVNRMLHSLWVAPSTKTPPGRRAMRGGGVVIDADDLPPGLAVGDVISGDVARSGQPGGDDVTAVSHAWLAGVPLTTSPVPGTTLGVIGAPLGPSHGGGMLFDTPGLAGKDGKAWQELVERVVSQAAEHTEVSEWLKDLAAERRAKGGAGNKPAAADDGHVDTASRDADGVSGEAAAPSELKEEEGEAGRRAAEEARPAVMPLWSGLPAGVVPPADCSADPVAGAPPSRVLAARTPVKAARCLMPVRPLRARHVRLIPGSSLLLGGLGRIDYEHLAGDGVHMLATAWTGLDVRTVPRWRADELLDRHAWQGGQIWPAAGRMAEPTEGTWLYDAAHEEERWLAEEGRSIWGSEMRLGTGPTAVAAAAAEAAEGGSVGRRGSSGGAVGNDACGDDAEVASGRGLAGAVGGGMSGRADDRRRQRRSRQEGRAPVWRPATHGELAGAAGFRMVDWAEGVDAEWSARPRGGNPGRTRYRRQERHRRAIVDVVFGGMGWLALTPIEVEGMYGWERAVKGARFLARAVPGAAVSLRQPLLPFEASGTRTRDWQ